jgi:hypothetical protein
MHIHQQVTPGFVLRPAVVLCVPWGGVCAVWFIWVILTARALEVGGQQVLTLMTSREFLIGSTVNAVLFLLLLADFRVARRSPPGFRRGHVAGIALAVLGMAFAQAAFWIAKEAIEIV